MEDDGSASPFPVPSPLDGVDNVVGQFVTLDQQESGPQLDLPLDVTTSQLDLLLNELLANPEPLPYSFYVNEEEVADGATLRTVAEHQGLGAEDVLRITYQPQAVFRVVPVSRCTASLPGHTDAVVSVAFSSDGSRLATGSGDKTVRLWDLFTQTPLRVCKGHEGSVLCLSWAPDGRTLASGGAEGTIRLWGPEGQPLGVLRGHRKWINAIAWRPLHAEAAPRADAPEGAPISRRLASASKDGTCRVWDVVTRKCLYSLSGHTAAVTCLRWGGHNVLYTGSQDTTVKVWAVDEGKLIRTLKGHAHWVNTMAASSDYVLRVGPHDHETSSHATPLDAHRAAVKRWQDAGPDVRAERLVTGSDDFTLFLWDPLHSKRPLTRLTGHQQLINVTAYSPDGRRILSASFDKSMRLWDGVTGKFVGVCRGHVAPIFQACWSSDNRLIVTGSRDSTLKIWDAKTRKQRVELPGHADEVYAVDWSPDGKTVASGSKDRMVKLWRN